MNWWECERCDLSFPGSAAFGYIECPKCHKPTVTPALKCSQCGDYYKPADMNGDKCNWCHKERAA